MLKATTRHLMSGMRTLRKQRAGNPMMRESYGKSLRSMRKKIGSRAVRAAIKEWA